MAAVRDLGQDRGLRVGQDTLGKWGSQGVRGLEAGAMELW